MKISNLINKEVKNLEVVIENNKFSGYKFESRKINVEVLSNILWNNIKSSKYEYDPNIPNEVLLYTSLMEKFYDKKYQNRKLLISHDDSTIAFTLKNLTLKMPLSHYYVLKFISGKDTETKFISNNGSLVIKEKEPLEFNKFISNELKIPDEIVQDIINKFTKSNLITPKTNKSFKLNQKILDIKNKIDFTKIKVIKKDEVEKEVEYDKETLLDCYLIKIAKQNKNLSFGKYIYLLRKNLSKLFIPNDTLIKSRLSRMIKLEYIKENDNSYEYIP